MRLTIGYLYPSIMSQYGDRGNIICLLQRCRWREIDAQVKALEMGDKVDPSEIDLFFMGGGADSHQRLIAQDLVEVKGEAIRKAVEEGAAALLICGGYQLFGHFYRTFRGDDLPGLGILDVHTIHWAAEEGSIIKDITTAGKGRMVGNLIVEWQGKTLIGFENHGGRTYLGPKVSPLGKVLLGRGNNGRDGWEGAVYKNVIGTYLHGPVLPKNPHLADYLIAAALSRRYGQVELTPLDDRLEWEAHVHALQRARQAKGEAIAKTSPTGPKAWAHSLADRFAASLKALRPS